MQGLTDGPRAGLTESVVLDSISWDRGMRTRWGVDILDSSNQLLSPQPSLLFESADVQWAFRVPEGVNSRATDIAAVRRTASLAIKGSVDDFNVLIHRYRPWIETQASDGTWVRWNQGVFVSTLPAVSDDGVWLSRTLSLADKTHVWSKELDDFYVAEFNKNIILFVREILEDEFDETDFDLPASSEVIEEDMVFEPGDTWLNVMNAVLEAGGFDPLIATAEGLPHTRLATDHADQAIEQVYEPGGQIKIEADIDPLLPEVPNVLIFTARRGPSLSEEGDGIRTVKNQDIGPGSIDARGGLEVRRKFEVDAQPGPPEDTNQFLDEIAYGQAARYFAGGGLRFKGTIGLNPRHDDRDIIAIVKADFDMDDNTEEWIVTGWDLPLRNIESEDHALMSIEAERRVVAEDYYGV